MLLPEGGLQLHICFLSERGFDSFVRVLGSVNDDSLIHGFN